MTDSGSGAVALAFSEACERNKQPIFAVLQSAFAGCKKILEIGSGSGQHAVYFGANLPEVTWQTADQAPYLPALRARVAAEAPANVLPPVELDVRMETWPVSACDGVFSANTLHYMSEACVQAFFNGVGRILEPGGVLVVYGPFRYAGAFTSASNARFDEWLRNSDPERGVRDFEWVCELAEVQGLGLVRDVVMPANNQCLVWGK